MTGHEVDLSDMSDQELEIVYECASKERQRRLELQIKAGKFPTPHVGEVAVFQHHPVKAVESYQVRCRAKGLDLGAMTIVTIMRHAVTQQATEKKT